MRQFVLVILVLVLTGCSGTDVLNLIARGGGPVERDVSYGPLDRQTLDVYRPDDVTADTPVLLFVHGGSWQNGSKDDYGFLGSAFAREGIETVVVNYRVYPDVIFPAFIEDAAKALAFTKREIAGDRPVILAGHSAGAHIAALAAADPRFLAAEDETICNLAQGFVGIAGPYDYQFQEEVYKRIFPAEIREISKPINHVDASFPPALLLHGIADDTVLPKRTEQMSEALRAADVPVETHFYEGVDHIYILGAVAPLLRGRAPTFGDVTAFIRGIAAAGPGTNC